VLNYLVFRYILKQLLTTHRIGRSVLENWHPNSYLKLPAAQQVTYHDQQKLSAVLDHLSSVPPIVTPKECEQLNIELKDVALGNAFLLQGGDCAETFTDFNEANTRTLFNTLLQMALVLTQGLAMPVVKVGRVAGQFAKPRSQPEETRDHTKLPSYRGDMINSIEFNESARTPNPERLERCYYQSAATLNLLRSFMHDGSASLSEALNWRTKLTQNSKFKTMYHELANGVEATMSFLRACSTNIQQSPLSSTRLYASHEALHLPYESALLRKADDGSYFVGSGHMLWIGDRTRQLNGAHIELLRGVSNPIGIKIGPNSNPAEVVALVQRLNPQNAAGKITLIIRMGKTHINDKLPSIIQAISDAQLIVIWSSDPMHGNTKNSRSGLKTRNFDDITSELNDFFRLCIEHHVHPGGVHLELTGNDVTECTGGTLPLGESDLDRAYQTACDPRLNGNQALELAYLIAKNLGKNRE